VSAHAARARCRLLSAVAAAGLIAGTGAATAVPAVADAPSNVANSKNIIIDKLGEHDGELLAAAQAKGRRTMTAMFATRKGEADTVEAEVRDFGGTVGYRNYKVGWLRATLPTDKVTTVAAHRDVVAVDLNEQVPRPEPELASAGKGTQAIPPPGPATPDANPYLPTNETGAVAFKERRPTWDGRGVTIGILDSGIDLENPGLQTTSTGERKIVDWVTATDPLIDGDLTWRAMITTVTGPKFTLAGRSWTAPEGTFKFNRFSEAITAGSEPAGDVNRDGDTTDRWGILYRESDNAIWVDTDDDADFTDEALLRPYNEAFQVSYFGVDDPSTAVRDRMPFVVEFRKDVDLAPAGLPGQAADFVNIGIVESAHGSHVGGIAAGNNIFGGTADGAAPGAKLVSSRACRWGGGCTAVGITEGMIDLIVNRNVDVVNMSIGGLPALNDGASARDLLYDRLVSDFGVQIFLSAGNSGPGVNTIGEPAASTNSVASAASVSKDTWLANYGAVVSARLNMFNFSSRGPREDGGSKPDISAPGSAISTIPLWQPGRAVPEAGYALPPGLAMSNGTSMASPQSAGAAALLLSAGRATNTPITPAQLRQALFSSADRIRGVPVYAQGVGHVDVPGAWDLLRRGVTTQKYHVQAPVCSPLSQFLVTPHVGAGIYNRCAASAGGHQPGQPKTYNVTITRTSGKAGPVLHELSWLGNNGTFSGPSSVSLPIGTPKTIQIKARPSLGAHSAALRVDDPSTRGVDHWALNTVVAAHEPTAPSYGFSAEGTVERNRTKSFFVNVPAGVNALQVNLSGIATGSQTGFTAINPHGVPTGSGLVCYTNFSNREKCDPVSRAFANPIPGIWEIEVESRRTTPFLANPFELRATLQGVAVGPETLVLESAQAGQPAPVSWTLINQFVPLTVTAHGGPLGSANVQRPAIADGELQEFTIDVPSGASQLDVEIGDPSDPGADLDLYVVKDGVVVGQDADGDSDEQVHLANPAAGTYVVQVDGFAVPAGTTEYDYRDVFFATALGSVSVGGGSISLGAGASATVEGTVTAKSAPADGRQLFGEMTVRSSEGAVVGRSGVLVKAVTS
jgi:Subtilase family/Bacterial pre-peptidase C-terminal domain